MDHHTLVDWLPRAGELRAQSSITAEQKEMDHSSQILYYVRLEGVIEAYGNTQRTFDPPASLPEPINSHSDFIQTNCLNSAMHSIAGFMTH